MVAMPYILVNIVLDWLSLLFFCVTSAALLSRYPAAGLYLPARLGHRRSRVLVAHAVLLAVLSIGVVRLTRLTGMYAVTRFLFEAFFYIGFANSVVLSYQFLDTRYFRATASIPRRLLIALCSVVLTSVPVVLVVAVVAIAFILR
jgi:hypothetical protein